MLNGKKWFDERSYSLAVNEWQTDVDEERRNRQREEFNNPSYGYSNDADPVTFSLGYGSKENEILLADGHVDKSTLRDHENHKHYGSGRGKNDNVKDRGKYTGPDA